MDYKERWQIVGELGKGGQGIVHRVCDKKEFDVDNIIIPSLRKAITGLGAIVREEDIKRHFESFRQAILKLVRMEQPENHGALKILHKAENARAPNQAEARLKKEIEAMFSISHPNLLKILDYDSDFLQWYVSEFHEKGTLLENKERFTGNVSASLEAFRSLVEGVAELHKNSIVHRDIKPANVFVNSDGKLILGDFGLVFHTDRDQTRLTETFENVGTRSWMPAWAMDMRVEDVKSSFDVFSLGKLFWVMISNRPHLNLWYFDQEPYNLATMFPNEPNIGLVNELLRKCIVQFENDCLPDASALLDQIDKTSYMVKLNADRIADNIVRRCKVCGIGKYIKRADEKGNDMTRFGFTRSGKYKIFTCDHCGHVQFFSFHGDTPSPAWSLEVSKDR